MRFRLTVKIESPGGGRSDKRNGYPLHGGHVGAGTHGSRDSVCGRRQYRPKGLERGPWTWTCQPPLPSADKFCEVLLNRFAAEETRLASGPQCPPQDIVSRHGHTHWRVLPLLDAICPAGKQRATRKIRKERNCVLQFCHTRDILYIVTTDGDNLVPGLRLA